jgi:hypothetical protein
VDDLIPSQQVLLSFIAIALGAVIAARRCGLGWNKVGVLVSIALVGGLFAFLPGKKENPYVLLKHAQMYPIVFFLVFAGTGFFLYRKYIIPQLHEGLVLLTTINLIYWLRASEPRVWWVISIPVFLTFLSAVTRIRLSAFLRVALFIWAVVAQIILSFSQFSVLSRYGEIDSFVDFLELFGLGFTVLYMGSFFFMLVSLFPGKRETQYLRRLMKDEIPFLVSRISAEQVPPRIALVMITVLGIPLGLNAAYAWLPDPLALSGSISVGPIVLHALWRPVVESKINEF